jgi:hypothetical protein
VLLSPNDPTRPLYCTPTKSVAARIPAAQILRGGCIVSTHDIQVPPAALAGCAMMMQPYGCLCRAGLHRWFEPKSIVGFQRMSETMRDRLKRRIRWCMAIGVGGWLAPAFAMGVIGGMFTPSKVYNHAAAAVYLSGFVVLGGATFAARRTLCPACAEPIGKMIGMSVAFPFFGKPANFCPYCGVHLDNPVPAKPIS